MTTANNPSPTAIADLILEKYSPERMANELHSFQWRKSDFEKGWAERRRLEQELRAALDHDSDSAVSASISDIYRWGFGRNTPNVNGDDWRKIAGTLVREFSKSRPDVPQQKAVLKMLLDTKGIKIATASKWVCFCDQRRYAIYDSRVSIALREILSEDGKRLFPTVGRRKTKSSQYPNADVMSVSQMVEKYFLYLEALRVISERTRLKVAEIEMALFMIGK